MSKKTDFNPMVGPTIRHKWLAFHRLYRLASRSDLVDTRAALQTLTWDSPALRRWYLTCEYGDAHAPRKDPSSVCFIARMLYDQSVKAGKPKTNSFVQDAVKRLRSAAEERRQSQ